MSRKRRKGKTPRQKLAPTAFLRARLDTLWGNEAFPQQDDQAIKGDLDVLARDIKPGFLMQTMLHAYLSAPAESRARLDAVLPAWLDKRDKLATLEKMITNQSLGGELHKRALVWLKAAGRDTKALTSTTQDLFYQALYYGDESQAAVAVFWYTHPRKHRAQAFAFLIDHNPPWDGAVKDVFVSPRRRPQDLDKQFSDTWAQDSIVLGPISASQAKTKILTALNSNQAAKIRLPRDLILNREPFIHQVLSLPDAPDTPTFTIDDFDFLTKKGKRPEEIVRFEQTVGRRVRLDDGEELLVMGGPDRDDEW